MYRHEKTFINKTSIAVVIDTNEPNWEEKLKKVTDFEITRINETFKVDLVYLKGKISDDLTQKLDDLGFAWITEEDLNEVTKIEDKGVVETVQTLTEIRKKALLEKIQLRME